MVFSTVPCPTTTTGSQPDHSISLRRSASPERNTPRRGPVNLLARHGAPRAASTGSGSSRSPIRGSRKPATLLLHAMNDRRKVERDADRWNPPSMEEDRDTGSSPAAILLFALIGATATTVAVGQLRRTVSWFYTQFSRSQPYVYWEDIPRGPNRCGDAWRYYRRTRETSEDPRERVEHIRRMQDMFKKERSKCRDYRTWDGHNPNYRQHIHRDDWYRDAESFYANQRTNFRSMPREAVSYSLSHHYTILGLNRSRSELFSDAEIKNAFRKKAMEYHPDQNQNNKEVAEAKFKEVMDSYEAIKLDRQNGSC